jgi:transposase-like protein
MFDQPKTAVEVAVPTACPTCKSVDVTTTTGKAITPESYWRCVACGEMWNHARHRPDRQPRRTPYYR